MLQVSDAMETQKNTGPSAERDARREVVRLRALRMDSLELSGLALLLWLPLLAFGLTVGLTGFFVTIVLLVLEVALVHIQRIDVYSDRLILSRPLLSRTIEYWEIRTERTATEMFLQVLELELADGRKVQLSRPKWHNDGAHFNAITDSLILYRSALPTVK